jgi:hypothetical protein
VQYVASHSCLIISSCVQSLAWEVITKPDPRRYKNPVSRQFNLGHLHNLFIENTLSYYIVQWTPGLKRPGREADNAPSSFKMRAALSSLSISSTWHDD